ncbi:MAG: hypothetical protein IPG72_12505 [Ardenticatenales bacterium]|nr:hypothetical protein [Ardenticatenales bacterium]
MNASHVPSAERRTRPRSPLKSQTAPVPSPASCTIPLVTTSAGMATSVQLPSA